MTSNTTNTNPPQSFVCPLTKKVMMNPMMNKYGVHFERHAILEWLAQGYCYCPVTRKPLRPSNLISDKCLKFKIKNWAQANNHEHESSPPGQNEKQQDDQTTNIQAITTGALPPAKFVCPLTKRIIVDPVMTKAGINYERRAILQHLREIGLICPVTAKPLRPSGVISNSKLAWEIQQWNLYHGFPGGNAQALNTKSPPENNKHTRLPSSIRRVDAFMETNHTRRNPSQKSTELLDILDDVCNTIGEV